MNKLGKLGLWAILSVVAMVILGGVIGFVLLPRVVYADQGFFAAWCSALGVPRSWAAFGARPVVAKISSDVVITHELLGRAQRADIGHGATLALRCTMCHGPTGISYANSPNLAGQYAVVIYKQLRDYKAGMRTNAVMSEMARSLSDEQMREVADYYASLPRPAGFQLTGAAPAVVKYGAPMRNIAPCGSCHGDIDHTLASPWLKGEPQAYLRAELTAFASDERHNDINAQMRAIANRMTPEEIDQAAAYYAGEH
jgi:cytochrome c553